VPFLRLDTASRNHCRIGDVEILNSQHKLEHFVQTQKLIGPWVVESGPVELWKEPLSVQRCLPCLIEILEVLEDVPQEFGTETCGGLCCMAESSPRVVGLDDVVQGS
jgi:hypothetical protein